MRCTGLLLVRVVFLAGVFSQAYAGDTSWYPVNADQTGAGLVYSPSVCSTECGVTCPNSWGFTCWPNTHGPTAVTMTDSTSLSFTFQGVSVEFWGVPLAAGGTAVVTLDDQPSVEISMFATEPLTAPVDRKMREWTGLDSTRIHTITIRAKDAYNANNPKYVHFHRFNVVYPQGMVSITNANTQNPTTPQNTATVTNTVLGGITTPSTPTATIILTNAAGQPTQTVGISVPPSGASASGTNPTGMVPSAVADSNPSITLSSAPGSSSGGANGGSGGSSGGSGDGSGGGGDGGTGGVATGSNTTVNNNNNSAVLIGGVVGGALVFLGLLAIAFVLYRQRKKPVDGEIPPPSQQDPGSLQNPSDQNLIPQLRVAPPMREKRPVPVPVSDTTTSTSNSQPQTPAMSPSSPYDLSPVTPSSPPITGGSGDALGLSIGSPLQDGDIDTESLFHSPPPRYDTLRPANQPTTT